MVDFIKFKKQNNEGEDIPKKRRFGFSFKRMLLWFLAFFIISSIISSISMSIAPKIAVVPISGAIMTSSSSSLLSSGGANSREISESLYEIAEDSSIKGVILDINSPGGSPVASEEISMAIEYVKEQGIPVYAVIGDAGASGAFWIAMSADKVYASSMSMIGSVGVTSAGLGIENLIKDYNITYRRQTAGEFKDMGSPFRAPTEVENMKIQKMLDEVHEAFITHIAKARNLSYSQVKEDSTGEIFLGTHGLQRGYIDEIGNYRTVLNDMKELVGESSLVINYGPKPSLFDGIGIESIYDKMGTKSSILLQ
ncbi:MAG: signal peptide peptidase SppA [Nanoarchaeales archaeon]|nr:signal peptide peptidase SppA [Nanoarchaeales archaeon]